MTRILPDVYRLLRWPLALALSGLSLYLALRDVQLPDLAGTIVRARPVGVALALCSVAVNTLAKALRWKLLMGSPGRGLPLMAYLASLLAGQALNTIYPARLGDLARAYDFSGRALGAAPALSAAHTLGSIVLEKLLDLLAYVALAILLVIWIPLPGWMRQPLWGMAALTGVLLLAIVGIAWGQERLENGSKRLLGVFPERWRGPLGTCLSQGMASLAILRSRADLLALAAWTALIWATALLNNHLVLLALGISLPLTASILLLLALTIGISLPSVPGRIGIFEYTCQLSLAVFAVPAAPALSYGVLLHAIVFSPTTLLGLACLAGGWGRRHGAR